MEEVIKLAKYYIEVGYSIEDAISTAINIVREKEIDLYEWSTRTSIIISVGKAARKCLSWIEIVVSYSLMVEKEILKKL